MGKNCSELLFVSLTFTERCAVGTGQACDSQGPAYVRPIPAGHRVRLGALIEERLMKGQLKGEGNKWAT